MESEHKASSTPTRTDRRWYPLGDPQEWAGTTRRTVFESVKRCIAKAIGADIKADTCADELRACDEVFRELQICTDAYARGLCALGQTEDGVVALILVAAKEAAHPAELHPAIVGAIEQWCREGHAAASQHEGPAPIE